MRYKEMLVEFYNSSFGYMTSATDSRPIAKKSDTRRPRLTLKHLNKLRQVKDFKRKERDEYLDNVQKMYRSHD